MNVPAQVETAIRDLRGLLNSEAMRKQVKMALPSVLPIDRFLRTLFTTINKTPDLALCDRDSVMAGVMTAASLGLEIDPALGRAYLIPFKDRRRGMVAQFIIGYKGYIDLFYRSGQAAGLVAEAVYEKDEFQFELGLEPKLKHIPSEETDRGALKYTYAIAFLENGGKVWRVLNRSAVMRAKASSRGAESEYSPWNTSEEQMWVKTGIRSLASRIPLSAELRDAIAIEEGAERESTIDVSATVSAAAESATKEAEQKAEAKVVDELPLKVRVNSRLVEAGRMLPSGRAQAIVDEAVGKQPISSLDDAGLQKLLDALTAELSAAQTGGAK